MGSDRQLRKQKRGFGSALGLEWEEKTRAKIQASQITNRLISFVEGTVALEPAQVTAAGILLRKVLPDLSASENKTEVLHRYVARLPAKAENTETWQQQNAPQITIQ